MCADAQGRICAGKEICDRREGAQFQENGSFKTDPPETGGCGDHLTRLLQPGASNNYAKRIMIQAKAETQMPKVRIGAVRFWRRVAVIVSLRCCSGVFRL